MKFSGILGLLLLNIASGAIAEESKFAWVDRAEGVSDLVLGDAPVLRYMHAFDNSSKESTHETYKVFHHVFGPESGKIITKGAGGKYTHHRGLYVGWNKTQTTDGEFDFWHCRNGAHLKHVRTVERTGGPGRGRMVSEIHWNDPDGQPVIVETRTVEVRALNVANGRAWQIDWSTQLQSKRGAIQLRGDRQHAGFQFRAAQPVADAESARFIRPAGFPEQPEAFQVGDKGDPPAHINLKWFAMHYPLEDSEYTIEYFEAPGQPAPSLFSERPYGRFGAFYKAELDGDQPLVMTYRVVVSEGDAPSREKIDARHQSFAASLKAETP